MKMPARPAPSVPQGAMRRDDATSSNITNRYEKLTQAVIPKKKPPPRPPPPNFKNSVLNNNHFSSISISAQKSHFADLELIDWSFPLSDPKLSDINPSSNSITVANSSFFGDEPSRETTKASMLMGAVNTPFGPTVIRAQPKSKKEIQPSEVNFSSYSPPMPTISPPKPPMIVYDLDDCPYGIALYRFPGQQKDDLSLEVNDIVLLIHQINDEWLYGKIGDTEGIFPASFINICIPLPEISKNTAVAIYEFQPQLKEDLKLVPGQKIAILKRISEEWLYGESNGFCGQFPTNCVDRVPPHV